MERSLIRSRQAEFKEEALLPVNNHLIEHIIYPSPCMDGIGTYISPIVTPMLVAIPEDLSEMSGGRCSAAPTWWTVKSTKLATCTGNSKVQVLFDPNRYHRILAPPPIIIGLTEQQLLYQGSYQNVNCLFC